MIELADRFGVHRSTVTAILRRQGVTLRLIGLSPTDVPHACQLYRDGWSLARLGAKFGVDDTTVWRRLQEAGVTMPSANQRGTV